MNQNESRIRDSFARQTMMTTAGAELVSVEEGRVTIAAPVSDGFRQQAGYSHAGLIFALGDTAAGYAALTVMPADVDVLTVEMKINLMSPGMGRLVAEGRVLKPGRRLVIVAADVWAEAEGKRRHVAALQGTMIPVEGS
ncbi:PaaI family thioesterase [Seohaeicola zhoushanensis]|uniref:Thioesterase n=1 Tax=Seohaeicola zhoushanensis TaxID=1569283 RepID=A0A8J3M8A9_9RHOB|nr:PaaI family thioesterase [Seohaeicola zhoushanensis]GHF53119.1 thioesterase [Seohaeicola zhoushanensis]